MRQSIKNIFLKIFDPIAFRLGYRKKELLKSQNEVIDLYSKNNLLGNFFGILKQMKFNPKHIVDVGANHGTWTRETLKYFPDAQYTLLEPQAEMEKSIKDILEINSKVSFNAFGAGKQKGSFKFTIVDRDDSCSFRFSEEQAKERGFRQIDVPVVTLNEFIRETNLPIPDIIKIDAEGLDLDVLEGASDFFGKTEVFMVEAAIVNKHLTNSFLSVINFMDTKGYKLFDLTDLNRPFQPSVLWLVELVFVKKNGEIDSHKWI